MDCVSGKRSIKFEGMVGKGSNIFIKFTNLDLSSGV